MDIRSYFQKIRETERSLPDEWVVVASLETPEGGKAGRFTEVSRSSAAKMIVESKARLASDDERASFYNAARAAYAAAEEARLASKIQLTVVADHLNRAVKQRHEKG